MGHAGIGIAVGLIAAIVPAVAHGEPIPAPIAAMIDAAAVDPAALKIVADLARKTNPGATAEIDARVAEISARSEAARTVKLASQGIWQGWSGEGALGAAASSGNTSNTGLAIGAKIAREGLRWKHTLSAGADFQRDNGVTSKERYLAGYSISYKLSPRLFAFGLLGYEKDRFAGYDSRFKEGVGLGYKVIDRPRLTLAVEGGPALRQSKFTDGGSDSSVNARLAGNLVWKIGPAVTLTETASYFIGGQSSTPTSETALTAKISGALAVRLSFLLQNESNPEPLRRATDTTSRVSLVYGF